MKKLAIVFITLTAALIAYRFSPPPVQRAGAALAKRLGAELRPVVEGVERKVKAPEPDPTQSMPSAATLSAPTAPKRRAAATAEGTGQKAPLLSKGAPDQDLQGAMDAPLLLDHGEVDQTRALANKLIFIAGGLAAFFMLVAWFRGDPNAKSLT
ncbi:MAG: hypothetical protein HY553_09395 [Elusimicrobia bacterium]|nr:hypothetical protein [Elusimicrobiota bacterium]